MVVGDAVLIVDCLVANPFGFTKPDYSYSTFICISRPFVGFAAPCMCFVLDLEWDKLCAKVHKFMF